jgi:two-component system nitrogen regulation response regulator GlnG
MSQTPPDKPTVTPVTPGTILVADDEESIRWVLERACTQGGHEVVSVASGGEALAALRDRSFDVALVDIKMPDLSGLDVLSRAREGGVDTLFIIMTAQNTMANAIEATKRGAYDYLTKPFDLDQVAVLIGRALELRRLTRYLERLRGELDQRHELVIGRTPAMQEVYKVIGRVAPTDATVLIQGETGTGKELVAKTLHYHSARRGPFVALNCSAIPNELLESELFGYERGAFTGAVERRIGKFEAAADGTLFLDEIADMPLALQAKLLRVLQEREFTRVGGREAIRADVRIIAASNQDIEAAVRAGRFREDLFFRLNVVRIHVPPLRDRKGDVPELIEFFVDKVNRDLGTAIVGVSHEARDLLMRHSWPGNVRELENALLRAAVLARGRTLVAEDFALAGQPRQANVDVLPLEEAVRRRLAELLDADATVAARDLHATLISAVERPLIEVVLERAGGNQVKAAEMLGINRNTLRKKITELGIEVRRGPGSH